MQKRKFDELISHFNRKVSDMSIDQKYKMELLGMISAIGFAHEKEHSTNLAEVGTDCISRQAAIKDAESWVAVDEYEKHLQKNVVEWLKEFPPSELSTNLASVGTDLISRQQAIDDIWTVSPLARLDRKWVDRWLRQLPPIQPVITHEQAIDYLHSTGWMQEHDRQMMLDGVHRLTAQPEPHEIGYDDCANALLKMWMDDVLTDGEYYRIANKLNKKWGKTELLEPYTEPYKGVTT